jgi:hypothetical protein
MVEFFFMRLWMTLPAIVCAVISSILPYSIQFSVVPLMPGTQLRSSNFWISGLRRNDEVAQGWR